MALGPLVRFLALLTMVSACAPAPAASPPTVTAEVLASPTVAATPTSAPTVPAATSTSTAQPIQPTVARAAAPTVPPYPTAIPTPHPTVEIPLDARPGLVDIGGFRLFMTCAGAGSPPVILDAGLNDSARTWNRVQPELATLTQACAYDRADTEHSDSRPSHERTTALLSATELHALLGSAHIAGPHVLVGHSYAGAVEQVYAGQYPQEVAGLVLVDPVSGSYFRGTNNIYEDVIDFDASRQQVEAARLPDVPLIVLTGGRGPYGGGEHLEEHRAIAARSPHGKHVIASNSGHVIQRDQPDAVITAIREVVEAARTKGR